MKKRIVMATMLLTAMSLMAEDLPQADWRDIALLPQQNEYRNVLDLSGVWDFRTEGQETSVPIAVPGSWNDQIEGLHHYMGRVWYERTTFVPTVWKSERVFLRVGSANYLAKVRVNGQNVGMHEGGHLPFAFDISGAVKYGQENRITIEVENELRADRVPLGNVKASRRNYPHTNYDFFPFGGLHRNVLLYTVPKKGSLRDVTVSTALDGTVTVKVEKTGSAQRGRVSLKGQDGKVTSQTFNFSGNTATATVKIPHVQLWSPESPYLYETTVALIDGSKTVDVYRCQTGVRTIAVEGNRLLLNGQPIKLRGFGKHEGFPVFGRAFAQPVAVKDFELMRWTGANSFRTSHYPYDESVYEMADRLGFLIIDEMPSVGLFFYDEQENIDRRRVVCDQYLREMIARDKNHPSVIVWSVANEPSYQGMGGANYDGKEQKGNDRENEQAIHFLGGLVRAAKEMDPTRLATFVGVSGGPASWLGCCDIICINRYYGWYTNPGDMPAAIKVLDDELDRIYGLYHKPIMLTEFGADAIPGEHSEYGVMFSEEFQCNFITDYLNLANTKEYVVGMHIWNLADFTTGQAMFRVAAKNFKGVFTQDRKPKMAAHLLHNRWTKDRNKY